MDPRRMCPHCRAFITDKDKVCPYCNESVGPRYAERVGAVAIGGFIPSAHFNTMMILLINVGLFLASGILSLKIGAGDFWDINGNVLVALGAKVGFRNPYFGWWRLVTAGFLHGGLFHILMNSWVLFDLGAQVEETFGASRMWVIYFCANFTGFLLSAWWSPGISIGASAGLCGLIGAMIALGTRHRNSMAGAMRGMYVRWAVYTLILGFMPLRIDNAAHIGGFLGGFAVAYIADTPRLTGPTERLWRVAAYSCVVLTAVSFLKMWLFYSKVSQ